MDSNLNQLYIADTFNNLIRCADLNTKNVVKICGLPLKNYDSIGYYDYVGGKKGNEQKISSPWDLCFFNKENSNVLLICCAGTHQMVEKLLLLLIVNDYF